MPALERTGIIGFRWHDLRHTFASRLVMEGVPLKTVANYLGTRAPRWSTGCTPTSLPHKSHRDPRARRSPRPPQ